MWRQTADSVMATANPEVKMKGLHAHFLASVSGCSILFPLACETVENSNVRNEKWEAAEEMHFSHTNLTATISECYKDAV